MITWPSLIHYRGEDELSYISDDEEWSIDPDLHFHSYDEGDTLIDSHGKVYSLPYDNKEKKVVIKLTDRILSIEEFGELIIKHLASLNQCCVSKISISSFEKGMLIVEKTNE